MRETVEGYADILGARIYYEVSGQGQPLIMIHAGVADSRQWNGEFARFSDRFRVVRYDLRGFGKSEPVDADYRHIQDLEALLAFLEIKAPVVLMGCSMGGGLAMDYALANPGKVKALIMVDSGPSGLKLDVPPHPKADEAEAAYEAGDLDLVAELETQIWFDGMGRKPGEVDPQMRALALEMDRQDLAHDAKQLGKRLPDAETPAAGRLQELKIPVLIVVGEHDIPFIQAAADFMQDHLASAKSVAIPDAAHLPNMDHPGLFQDEVLAFLNDISL